MLQIKHVNKNTINKKILKNRYWQWLFFVIIVTPLIYLLEITNTINLIKNSSSTPINQDTTELTTNTVDYGPPRTEDSIVSPEKITTPKPESKPSDTSAEISVLITRASRSSVGVFIEKIDAGKCVLTVTQSGIEKIKMESVVIQERDYSTCQGFDLNPTKLDSTPITIKLSVISGNRSGSAKQEVN